MADAFLFAFRIPNLFRQLFGEGALTASYLPVLTAQLENDPRSGSAVGQRRGHAAGRAAGRAGGGGRIVVRPDLAGLGQCAKAWTC